MNKISTKHLIFLFLSVTTISLRSYSSIFIALGGRDTWIATLISGILFSLYTMFIIHISIKLNSFDFKEIFLKTYPKPLGNILIFIFSVGLFLTAVESASAESSAIHTNIFIETPIWYCLLFFIVPAGYIITKKFKSILTVVLITTSAVILNNIILEMFLLKYRDIKNLLPILSRGNPKDFLLCILLTLGSLSSIAIIFPFFKFLDKKANLKKFTLLTVIAITILVTHSIASVISTFGPNRASNIFYPEFIQSQVIQLYGFIEFGNLLFIFRIVCYWFIKYILCGTSILFLYKEKFTNKKVFAIIFSFLTFVFSYLLSQNQFKLFSLLKTYNFLMLGVFILVPFTTYAMYFFKNKRKH